jgi:hypothetical protein
MIPVVTSRTALILLASGPPKTWFWLSSAWMALARLGKAAPYSTLTFLLLAPAGISDRLGFELTAHQPY